MDSQNPHQHAREEACTPACPQWAEWALHFYFLQGRHAEMRAACEVAEAVEWVMVAVAVPGVDLPEHLSQEELVRLNLVAGRDTPALRLDEWGIRCELTFRGQRRDVGLPWASIVTGVLRPPARKRPRFGVIEGGKKD